MIGRDLDQRRTRDHRRLVRCLRAVRFQRLIEEMAGWIARGPWVARREKAVRRKPPKALKAYCVHKLDRWHRRLIRKGRHLATMKEAARHRLRIKAKHFRYMLEALNDIAAVRGAVQFRGRHKAARRLQRALGDLRDLRHFGRLGDMPPLDDDEHGGRRPPGYRKQKQKLLEAAIVACHSLAQADTR
jgi:CHAD domain-containing protein